MSKQLSDEVEGFLRSLERRWSNEALSATIGDVNVTSALDEHIEEADHAWDTIQNRFRLLLSHLRSYRNDRRPIHKLPAEILQIIFQLAGDYGFDYETNVRISTVCSRWREVAMNHPQMWSSFDASSLNQRHLELYLARNSSCPLDLTYGPPPNDSWPNDVPQWFQDFTSQNWHRIRSLRARTQQGFLAGVTITQVPLLEELRLHMIGFAARSPFLHPVCAPRLRVLEFGWCRRPWISGMYVNLTHLRLEWFLHDEPAPDEDIVAILRDSPQLESLELLRNAHEVFLWPHEEFTSRMLNEAHRTRERFAMSRLRRVKLAMQVGVIVRLLVAMELPEDIETLSVEGYFGQGHASHAQMLFSARCLSGDLLSTLRTMKIYDGGDRLLVTGSRASICTDSNIKRGDNVLSVICQSLYDLHHQQYDILQHAVEAICRDHTFPLIHDFHFYSADERLKRQPDNSEHRATSLDVAALLHHLSSTTSLTLRFENLGQCGKILRGLQEHLQPSSLPSLTGCTMTVRDYRLDIAERDLDAVIDFLQALRLSRPIETLRFSNTYIKFPSRLKGLIHSFARGLMDLNVADTCLPVISLATIEVPSRNGVRKRRFPLAERMDMADIDSVFQDELHSSVAS